MIYFAQNLKAEEIKIGYAADATIRMKQHKGYGFTGVDVARFGGDSTATFVRYDAMQTFAEVMQSDLVKEHGVERALWIIVNAHRKCSELLEFRKKRIEELEAECNASMDEIAKLRHDLDCFSTGRFRNFYTGRFTKPKVRLADVDPRTIKSPRRQANRKPRRCSHVR